MSARVAAFERSRWWRLHPRFLWHRPPPPAIAAAEVGAFDQESFASIRTGSLRSARAVAPIVHAIVRPSSVVDVGGGEGWWAQAFAHLGASRVVSIDDGDQSEQAEGVEHVRHDLGAGTLTDLGQFDLALCLEVVEHLDADVGDLVIDALCSYSSSVLFSAAIPGQGGRGHVNERWPAYWVERFMHRGYRCSGALRLRLWHDDRIEPWYRQNLLFASCEPDRFDELFATPLAESWPLVHPEMYFRQSDLVLGVLAPPRLARPGTAMRDETEALLAENRRLRDKNRRLDERLASFERSRWWRLHPRFALRRRVRSVELPPRSSAQTEHQSGELAEAQSPAGRFRSEVLAHGTFTRDAFTHNIAGLESILGVLGDRPVSLLEIGSHEGMSAAYFLWRLPDARLTCVDVFERLVLDAAEPGPDLEATFDANVALIDASRVRKLVGDSRRVLLDLQERAEAFDFVYVDGSHLALDVLVDAALVWRLLEPDGIVVFDDYAWDDFGEDPLLRPGPAIDALLTVLDGKYEIVSRGAQLAIRKSLESHL